MRTETSAYYGHLSKNGVAVHLDQRVSAGEMVALSGNTGMSTGPHLHLSVSWLGEPIPTKFRTVEGLGINLEEGKWYTKPYSPERIWRARFQRLMAKFIHVLR